MPGRIYFGCVREKDAAGMAAVLEADGAEIALVQMGSERGLGLAELRGCFAPPAVAAIRGCGGGLAASAGGAAGGRWLDPGFVVYGGEFLAAGASRQADLAWQ
ncbi:MAG: hypothetical protein HC901_02385 [Bdellovibrionaceae bacterium]|nr:hypothetical protein [Pseudobdellovibrionaceae bacterium]